MLTSKDPALILFAFFIILILITGIIVEVYRLVVLSKKLYQLCQTVPVRKTVIRKKTKDVEKQGSSI